MNESIKKMYEQEPKTWYAKIIVALIVARFLHGHFLRFSPPDQTEADFPSQERSSAEFSTRIRIYCLTSPHPVLLICYWKPCVSHS